MDVVGEALPLRSPGGWLGGTTATGVGGPSGAQSGRNALDQGDRVLAGSSGAAELVEELLVERHLVRRVEALLGGAIITPPRDRGRRGTARQARYPADPRWR